MQSWGHWLHITTLKAATIGALPITSEPEHAAPREKDKPKLCVWVAGHFQPKVAYFKSCTILNQKQ